MRSFIATEQARTGFEPCSSSYHNCLSQFAEGLSAQEGENGGER